MTAQDIYIFASAILWEGDNEDTDSKKFTVQFLNHLLPEALGAENSLRRRAGLAELETAPIITAIEDAVPYRDILCRTALVYGLCWHYYDNVNDSFHSELYRNLFISSLQENTVGVWETLPGL